MGSIAESLLFVNSSSVINSLIITIFVKDILKFLKQKFMKKILSLTFLFLVCFVISSCSDDEVITQLPMVRDSQTDMQVLSRFVDINESTNEYYINENKKTRSLSYVTGADWEELEKVSAINLEKCERNLRDLNAQVAMAIEDPNIAYMVFSVNGNTLVKKLRDTSFDFVSSQTSSTSTRALPYSLDVYGGSDTSTGKFKDASRTIRMNVNLDLNVQFNSYFFQILSPDAKPDNDDSILTPESIAFSGTGPLWNNSFIWTAYWGAQGSDGLFSWEFKSKGSTPSFGHIAQCTFSY